MIAPEDNPAARAAEQERFEQAENELLEAVDVLCRLPLKAIPDHLIVPLDRLHNAAVDYRKVFEL